MSDPDVSHARSALAASKTIALTTYRRDGSEVTTPVWFHSNGDVFYVTGRRSAYRHSRIEGDQRVVVAPCTSRGKVVGVALAGRAEFVEPADMSEVIAGKKLGAKLPTHRLGLTCRRR